MIIILVFDGNYVGKRIKVIIYSYTKSHSDGKSGYESKWTWTVK